MILRYLVLFGGIVMMITGCNNLVSQNFGTHRLRTIDVEDADAQAIGEADYVEVAGAMIGSASVTTGKVDYWGKTTICRPILKPREQGGLVKGTSLKVALIGCFKTENPACFSDPACLPYTGQQVIGLVGAPGEVEILAPQWRKHSIEPTADVTYIQLGEKPMAWHWNLLFFVGGILLAFIPEAIRHNRKATNKFNT